jgi:hypothetical protein
MQKLVCAPFDPLILRALNRPADEKCRLRMAERFTIVGPCKPVVDDVRLPKQPLFDTASTVTCSLAHTLSVLDAVDSRVLMYEQMCGMQGG